MAWTVPRTWVPGEIVTAALMNQQLRDNLLVAETTTVTTVEDLIVATGPNALTRQGLITAGEWMQVEAGAIGSGTPLLAPGFIAWYNGSTCPEGWSEALELRGRTPLGLPAGGTLAGTRGTALGNFGTVQSTGGASHTHGPGSISSSYGGGHTHQTEGGFGSGGNGSGGGGTLTVGMAGDHNHGVSPSGATGSAGGTIDVTMPYIQLIACRSN